MIESAEWDDFCRRALNGTLFHTREFLAYHPEGRFAWDHAVIRNAAGGMAALWPAASADEGATWWSGAGASFGGPVLPADADADTAAAAIAGMLDEAKLRGYRRVRVTPPPPLYEEGEAGIVRGALLAAGFRVERCEVFQAAPLAGKEPADLLSGPARRGAAKAERERVEVRPETAFAEFHALLERDRAAVGASPVHSAAELADLGARFADRQALLLARLDGELVAGTWLLRAAGRVALSFYVCQDREHRRLRATNLVQLRALDWACAQGCAYLDFGTSSIGGEINPGLFEFKEAHGGRPHDRETFVRDVWRIG